MEKVIIETDGWLPPRHSRFDHFKEIMKRAVGSKPKVKCSKCISDFYETYFNKTGPYHKRIRNSKEIEELQKNYSQSEEMVDDITTIFQVTRKNNFSGRVYYFKGYGIQESANIFGPTREITICLDSKPNNESVDKPLQEYILKRNIEKHSQRVLEDILLHEITHLKFDVEEPLSNIIQLTIMKEFKKNPSLRKCLLKAVTKYLACSLSDIIVDLYMRTETTHSGSWIWNYRMAKQRKDGKNFTCYDGAYNSLRLFLYGSNPEKILMKHFSSIDKKAGIAVQDFIKRIGLKAHQYHNNKNLLTNKKNLKRIGRVFAEEFGQLLISEVTSFDNTNRYECSSNDNYKNYQSQKYQENNDS